MSQTTSDDDISFKAGCSPVCDVVRRPKRRKRKSRPWHRVLGIVASLPLIWVMVTGFFLNHSEDFKLDEKFTSAPWIMRAYGMMPKGEPTQTLLNGGSVVEWDGLVFYNNQVVDYPGNFVGAASDGDAAVLLFEDAALRYNSEGELLEMLDEISLPSLPLTAAGMKGDRAVVKNEQGWHLADEDWIEWEEIDEEGVEVAHSLPEKDLDNREQLVRLWNGGGLSYYRVVLDLHAGNFLGDFAKYFYDVVIVCTLWLIGTGLVLQYRTSKRARSPKS